MKQFSNRYIFFFSSVMVIVVAIILSLAATLLQPRQARNLELEKKKSILESINIPADFSNADELYSKYIIESFVINSKGEIKSGIDAFKLEMRIEENKPIEEQNLPVFIAKNDEGEKITIIPLEGKGLWGPIWGYISFKSDMNTIYGATFDHKGETPGLGAEINTQAFKKQFAGLKIFEDGKFVSVKVLKSNEKRIENHSVDAISGGTITSKALEAMLYNCIEKYVSYLKKNAE
ncbi:MAG: NADH:ubiquinone reductase (Na(+)-transporting) subunit C [Bacteroidales bacterium]|nr:NADH:ubiquinone reductase (Na(+)-transporting) subunit C [Bacteroidales bacterium]